MPTPAPAHDARRAPVSTGRAALSLAVVLGGLAALLFVPAGRLDRVGPMA